MYMLIVGILAGQEQRRDLYYYFDNFSSNKYFNTIVEIFYEAHKLSFNTSLLGLWAFVGKKISRCNARVFLLVNFKTNKHKNVPYKT